MSRILRTPVGLVEVEMGAVSRNTLIVVGHPTSNQMVADLMVAALKVLDTRFDIVLNDLDPSGNTAHIINVVLCDANDVDMAVKGILSIPGSFKV